MLVFSLHGLLETSCFSLLKCYEALQRRGRVGAGLWSGRSGSLLLACFAAFPAVVQSVALACGIRHRGGKATHLAVGVGVWARHGLRGSVVDEGDIVHVVDINGGDMEAHG